MRPSEEVVVAIPRTMPLRRTRRNPSLRHEATDALGRGDVDAAIVALREASAAMQGGLGDLSQQTIRGLFVTELAHELAWARERGKPTDYARVAYRFSSNVNGVPFVNAIATHPDENALLHAVFAYAKGATVDHEAADADEP